MTRIERFLTALGLITIVEISGWLVIRSAELAWHQWHDRIASHWPAAFVLFGSVVSAAVIGWMVLAVLRP